MNRRETRQRNIILKILRNTKSHPTADLIYEEARRELPSISKGTVYRNLKVLQESGLVNELKLDWNQSRYEAKQDPHYHFKCERCGKVMDIDFPVDTELNNKASKDTGLLISYHQLEFRGLCQDCRHKKAM